MTVEQNKFVSINYTLKDDEGNIVDTSINSAHSIIFTETDIFFKNSKSRLLEKIPGTNLTWIFVQLTVTVNTILL